MAIRLATTRDAEAITLLQTRGWQATYRGIMPDDMLDFPAAEHAVRVAKRRSWIETMGPDHRHWVVETAGRVVCWVATGPCRNDDLDAPSHELYAMYAEPAEIGKGHGRQLMAHCIADLQARGYVELVLWVMAANTRARRFYTAAGFGLDARVPPAEFRDTGAMNVRLCRAL